MPQEYYYKTPQKSAHTSFTVRGSRFIATLTPVDSESNAKITLAASANNYADATHHAYAYRIGTGSNLIERSSDDREPAGTAGTPMLQILQANNISDVIVVATRYFGGIKLGIGGLTRAYRDCARLSLKKAVLIKKEPLDTYFLKFTYEDLGAITKLIESLEGKILEVIYDQAVTVRLIIPSRLAGPMINGFDSSCRGKGHWEQL